MYNWNGIRLMHKISATNDLKDHATYAALVILTFSIICLFFKVDNDGKNLEV